MATKTISTWEEFKAAWTESITESTTYIITNDIDVSDTVIDSTLNCPGQIWSTHYVKTFTTNGDNVNIIGLTKYNSGTLFNISGEYGIVVFNKINFINCQITLGTLFGASSYNRAIAVVNSIITGYIYMINTRTIVDTRVVHFYYRNCVLNTKGYRTIGDYSVVVECWVHFEAQGTNSSTTAILQYGDISQSYYEGQILTYGIFINTSTIRNDVMNINANAESTTDFFSSTFSLQIITLISQYSGVYVAPYGNSTCLINSSRLTNYNTTGFVALTDSQLKSVAAINELAPNFPISN